MTKTRVLVYILSMKKITILFVFTILAYSHSSFDSAPSMKVEDEPKPSLQVETRRRVAVLDTGVSKQQLKQKFMCKDMPVFAVSGDGVDYNGHGTNVIGLVAEKMDKSKYCITSYSLSRISDNMGEFNYLLYKMQEHSIVGLNLSWANIGYDKTEEILIKKLTDKNVKVFVAAGNEKINLNVKCHVFPACHKVGNPKIYVIGNRKGNDTYSNYGDVVDLWVDGVKKGEPEMTGSSQATGIATGVFFSK